MNRRWRVTRRQHASTDQVSGLDPLSPEVMRFIASKTDLDTAILYRLVVAETRVRHRQFLQGRLTGLAALLLMLVTVVVLAAIGQPWPATIIGGTSLVAVFVTGR